MLKLAFYIYSGKFNLLSTPPPTLLSRARGALLPKKVMFAYMPVMQYGRQTVVGVGG